MNFKWRIKNKQKTSNDSDSEGLRLIDSEEEKRSETQLQVSPLEFPSKKINVTFIINDQLEFRDIYILI